MLKLRLPLAALCLGAFSLVSAANMAPTNLSTTHNTMNTNWGGHIYASVIGGLAINSSAAYAGYTGSIPTKDYSNEHVTYPAAQQNLDYNIGVELGYALNNGLQLGVDFMYVTNQSVMNGTVLLAQEFPDNILTLNKKLTIPDNYFAIMASAEYVFKLASLNQLRPYIGAGVGMAIPQNSKLTEQQSNVKVNGIPDSDLNESESVSEGNRDSAFAWQVMAGVDYHFTQQFSAGIRYTFLDTGIKELVVFTSNKNTLSDQLINATLSYNF